MTANQEKCFVHPQRPAAVRQNDNELRKIDGYVVGEHRLGIDIARAGENRGACVDHHRHAVRLRAIVHACKRTKPISIGVGRKELMRRMNFEPANAQFRKPVDFRSCVGHIFWVHGAKCEQPFRISRAIFRDPVIHFRRKTNHVGTHVIDQAGAFDSRFIQKFQE